MILSVSKQFKAMHPQFSGSKGVEVFIQMCSTHLFLIGNLSNVGTADGYSVIIGTEHLCNNSHADTSQLTTNDKLVLFDTSLHSLIVHEYVHFQQSTNRNKRCSIP
jgi:hypothetical protein